MGDLEKSVIFCIILSYKLSICVQTEVLQYLPNNNLMQFYLTNRVMIFLVKVNL